MGWKSTKDITRVEAKLLIIKRSIELDHFSNSELARMVEHLGYGEDPNLEHYGYNFMVND
jgi:hypothetical protein